MITLGENLRIPHGALPLMGRPIDIGRVGSAWEATALKTGRKEAEAFRRRLPGALTATVSRWMVPELGGIRMGRQAGQWVVAARFPAADVEAWSLDVRGGRPCRLVDDPSREMPLRRGQYHRVDPGNRLFAVRRRGRPAVWDELMAWMESGGEELLVQVDAL